MSPLPPSPEHAADCAAIRAALRREKLAARLAMPAAVHAEASACITGHLRNLLATRAPGTIAFCAPVQNEHDTRPLIAELLTLGWRAAMPVVVSKNDAMAFRSWTPDCAMTDDRHGIPIPAAGAERKPDVVLLPLVAFDPAGYRLGYGGGYFDRTLAAQVPRPLAFGVGFELARVPDIRPQAHDVRLDAIITEAGVLRPD